MVEQGGLGTEVPQRDLGARPQLGSAVKPPEAIGTMKYSAYKNWFMCIVCLYVIAKTYTEIEKTYSYATRQAAIATLEIMYLARGVWIGVR